MKKLLAIFAHPDDESFGPSAGTLAKYAREGAAVHYVCATRGEAGTVDERFLAAYPNIASLRTDEAKRAADVLGFAGLYFLPYRDSGMSGASDNTHPDSLFSTPVDAIAQRIIPYVRDIQPDVIITHDRYGWYGHPDHIKCYQAVLRAYELLYGFSGGTEHHLPHIYASTFPKYLVKFMAHVMPLFGHDPHHYGQHKDIDLVQIASWNISPTARIDVRRYLDVKARAAACHASQVALTQTPNPLTRKLIRHTERYEIFRRLFPLPATDEPMAADFFLSPLLHSRRRSIISVQPYQLDEGEISEYRFVS